MFWQHDTIFGRDYCSSERELPLQTCQKLPCHAPSYSGLLVLYTFEDLVTDSFGRSVLCPIGEAHCVRPEFGGRWPTDTRLVEAHVPVKLPHGFKTRGQGNG